MRERDKRLALGGALIGIALLAALPAAAPAATIAVNTTEDQYATGLAGECSLREAVQSSRNGGDFDECIAVIVPNAYGTNDTINLPAGTYTLDRDGINDQSNSTSDLDVNGASLTITGTGDPTITENFPTNKERIIDAFGGISLTLSGLTVSGGEATQAIDPKGGNVRFQGPGLLTLDDVDVVDGVANNSGGGQGGGVWSDAPVVIQNSSTIGGPGDGNVAGGAGGSAGSGGGVYVTGQDSTLTVNSSTISENAAAGQNQLGSFGLGGGIHSDTFNTGTITLTNAQITNNRSGGGTVGNSSVGGGIYVAGASNASLMATGGSISGNTAGGGSSNADGAGGGLLFEPSTGSVSLTGVTMSGNKAGGEGGTGVGTGGAIYSRRSVQLTNSTVSSNHAGVGTVGTVGDGGGLKVESVAASNPALTISGSTLSQNESGTDVGSGGAINMFSPGNLSITGSTLDLNETAGAGGAVIRAEADGGATPTDLIEDSSIVSNDAGSTAAPGAAGGGAIFETSGSLMINRSTIGDNGTSGAMGVTTQAGGLAFTSAFGSAGGSNVPGALSITNSTVSDNVASSGAGGGGDGGGLFTVGPLDPGSHVQPAVTITASTFDGNQADPDGNGGQGGNLLLGGSTAGAVDITGSIISNGLGDTGDQNCSQNIAGLIESHGGNVEGPAIGPFPSGPTNQCEFDQGTDTQADPLLGLPALNGEPPGSPFTQAPAASSPAINRYSSGCPATDERGITRPQGGSCDSGAFELVPAPVTPPVSTPAAAATTTPAATTPAKKKCKKGFKLKKGKCKRKKRKK